MKETKKVLEIEVPQGYEIDKENSTFEKIVFKKVEEELTYEKISLKLFELKDHYYTNADGIIRETSIGWNCPNAAPTEHQLQRLLSLNKLMNVAHYLNDGWEPDWENANICKYHLYYTYPHKKILVDYNLSFQTSNVYFKSEELAKQAVEILGEETIKLALGVI
jgi:hypothetical protein